MRPLPRLAVPVFLTLAPSAHAQAEATFPIEREPGEEQEPAPAPEESQETEPVPSPPPETAPSEVNPYGAPPAPPPPVPGNPYGTVPHRPPTPATNPYVGAAPAAPAPEPAEELEKTNWSVGGGLVAEAPGPQYGPYGRLSASLITPSLLFERRLTEVLHLLFQASVAYQKSRFDDLPQGDRESTLEELGFRFEGGLRWVANPGGAVELGMSHVVRVQNNQAISEGGVNLLLPGIGDADIDEWSLGLSSSFLAERRLIPHLWLRMGVGLVGLQYRTTKVVEFREIEDQQTGETIENEEEWSSSEWYVGLSPAFSLQLRLTF